MNSLTIKRIDRARKASANARNQWFKNYWNEVANILEQKQVDIIKKT